MRWRSGSGRWQESKGTDAPSLLRRPPHQEGTHWGVTQLGCELSKGTDALLTSVPLWLRALEEGTRRSQATQRPSRRPSLASVVRRRSRTRLLRADL